MTTTPLRVLLLGGRGAVGAPTAAALRDAGHHVSLGGRRPGDDVTVDLARDLARDLAPTGTAPLAEAAGAHDVVVNATGVEDPCLAGAIGATALVDPSASAAYLRELARAARGPVVLGAGIAPGVSTVLVTALVDQLRHEGVLAPGDAIDVGVVLGAGEHHGAQAVAWTAGLAGSDLTDPPEDHPVRNLRGRHRLRGPDGRARQHLRADFPDHTLVGRSLDTEVRTWLATTSPLATLGLAAVGRWPRLAPLVSGAPAWGSERWSITVTHRRSGRSVAASGSGQSLATGRVTALAAAAVVASARGGAVTAAPLSAVVGLDDLATVAGLRLHGVGR